MPRFFRVNVKKKAKVSGKSPTLLGGLAERFLSPVVQTVPERFRETVRLRAMGFLKIPLLFFISPSVEKVSDHRVEVRVGLNTRTKNHVGSMYFGVLAAGADCACGLLAMRLIERKGVPIGLIFKDFKAEFLKRAEGDVIFSCEQGREIADLIDQVADTGERHNLPVEVVATVPVLSGAEPVAKFVLTLSLKRQ
jgi:acyl-coenzyme A thioesterase PaaI-like protein